MGSGDQLPAANRRWAAIKVAFMQATRSRPLTKQGRSRQNILGMERSFTRRRVQDHGAVPVHQRTSLQWRPMVEGGCLTTVAAVLSGEIPDNRPLDLETTPGLRNANAGIVIDVAMLAGLSQEP